MQQNATNQMEIKKVLLRKHDGLKFVVIPKKSSLRAGDYVMIKKVNEIKNGNK